MIHDPGSAVEPASQAVEPGHSDPYGWYAQQEQVEAQRAADQQRMLRQLRLVLAAALVAFCAITLLLVRDNNALPAWLGISGPARIVRQHLEALNRGEARAAYEFFSQKYRREIPLRAYEQLVASHRAMFRTRVLKMETPSQSDGIAELETRLASSSGNLYVARFSMVRVEGHWFIDQIRWSAAPNPGSFTRV